MASLPAWTACITKDEHLLMDFPQVQKDPDFLEMCEKELHTICKRMHQDCQQKIILQKLICIFMTNPHQETQTFKLPSIYKRNESLQGPEINIIKYMHGFNGENYIISLIQVVLNR